MSLRQRLLSILAGLAFAAFMIGSVFAVAAWFVG